MNDLEQAIAHGTRRSIEAAVFGTYRDLGMDGGSSGEGAVLLAVSVMEAARSSSEAALARGVPPSELRVMEPAAEAIGKHLDAAGVPPGLPREERHAALARAVAVALESASLEAERMTKAAHDTEGMAKH